MKRTLLLVVSVLVAAVGTGVVALWATTTAKGKDGANRSVVAAANGAATPSARPTSTVAPTTVVSGHKGLAVTIANPGLAPGQWIDVAVTTEGGKAAVLYRHIAVLSVLADGRVVLGLTIDEAVEVLTRTSAGQALTALLPAPDDPAPPATSGASPSGAHASGGSASGGSTARSSRTTVPTGAVASAQPSPSGSPTASDQASSTP
jgi:hypothetical protein